MDFHDDHQCWFINFDLSSTVLAFANLCFLLLQWFAVVVVFQRCTGLALWLQCVLSQPVLDGVRAKQNPSVTTTCCERSFCNVCMLWSLKCNCDGVILTYRSIGWPVLTKLMCCEKSSKFFWIVIVLTKRAKLTKIFCSLLSTVFLCNVV